MKTLLYLIFAVSLSSHAQKIQGVVRYDTYVNLDDKMRALKDPNTPLHKKKEIESDIKFMKSTFEESYTLTFNGTESLYKVLPALGLGNEESQANDTQDPVYKNLGNKLYIIPRELFGKVYMIAEPLPDFQWKLHSDSKLIGKYICNKATYVKEYEVEEYVKTNDGAAELKLVKKEIMKTAWYCPSIPITNGPSIYGGLPGLILEVSDNSNPLIIRCAEINIKPNETVKIKRPESKRYYSEKEFKDIIKNVR